MKKTSLFILLITIFVFSFCLFTVSCVDSQTSESNIDNENYIESESNIDNESCVESEGNIDNENKSYEILFNKIFVDSVAQYEVTGFSASEEVDVEIPSTYEGLPVTKIGDYAFRSTTKNDSHFIKSIKIPDSIIEIGWQAFLDCNNLTSLTIGNGVTQIVGYIVSGCINLTYLEIGSSVCLIETQSFNRTNLKNIVVNKLNPYYKSINGDLYNITDKSLEFYARGKEQSEFTIPNDVKTIKNFAFANCKSLKKIIIGASVEEIEDQAFFSCENIESFEVSEDNQYFCEIDGHIYSKDGKILYKCAVGKKAESFYVPSSLTTVKYSAVENCFTVKNVYVENLSAWCKINGLYYFSEYFAPEKNLYINGELVSDIVVPDDVKILARYAFSGFKNIESIDVGDGVTEIEYMAFNNCKNLKEIKIGKCVHTIFSGAFLNYYCSSIQKVVVDSDNMTFSSKDGVLYSKNGDTLIAYPHAKENREFVIPSHVKEIERTAFLNCNYLQKIMMQEGLEIIGDSAFLGCSNLEAVEIPQSVTLIKDFAFSGCDGLKSVTITNPNVTIQNNVFNGSNNITSINIPASVIKEIYTENLILAHINSGEIEDGAFSGLKNIWFVQIDATKIGKSAFSGCINLEEIYLSEEVVSIGDYAFSSCKNLKTIILPDSVKEIGVFAFAYCNVSSIIIGEGVESIANNAFLGCDELETVYYKGEKDAWQNILIGEYGNACLLNAEAYYYIENQSDLPQDEGNYWHYDESGDVIVW